MEDKKFIPKIVDFILEKGWELDHVVIILPSMRAGKCLEIELASRYEKPIFSPEIYTIDTWIKKSSSFQIVDSMNILFEMYHVHLEVEKDIEKRSFDSFYQWGSTLLSDFEEIDKYLIDPKQLFKNLKDVKDIENWSFNSEELTEQQQKFLAFWELLPEYYNGLKDRLALKNWAFSGMAFREVAEKIELVSPEKDERQFIFAGFNALSLSEMTIIRKLFVKGRGHVLQNVDEFYYNAIHHEAGHFQRKLNEFLEKKPENFIERDMMFKEKSVEIIECAQTIAQVNTASTLLSKLSPAELNETLLLLADETLAGPMMKNLPQNIQKANITMGLQLRDTSVKLWVDLLFSIQENFQRFSTKSLYHKDLFKLWQHPFYQLFVNDAVSKVQREIEQRVINKNRIFLSPKNLKLNHSVLEQILELISTPWENDYRKGLQIMHTLNRLIFGNFKEENEFEKAIVKSFEKAVRAFQNTVKEGLPEMGLRIFKQLFQQHWGKHRIAYEGTPTDGLQMMGLLETRLLDFKNIICLGLNEGSMPPNNPIQTLIPMDLRVGFGMPTTRDKQGLFAHHFYRLLHKAEHLTITFSNASDEQNAEPSRYIQQLELEWSRLAKNLKLEKKTYTLLASPVKMQLDKVKKTPDILEKLDRILASSVSASALNKYLTCPLDFYYRYILEYGEEDEVEEEMNNSTLGIIIHNVLEELYEPFAFFNSKGEPKLSPKMLLPLDVERMLGEYEKLIKTGFKEHYDNDENSFMIGKNYLSYEMALSLTKKFLNKEKEWLMNKNEPLMIHSLERRLESSIKLNIHGKEKIINLKGFVDRMDGFGDKIRIVDYKSGKVKQEDLDTKKGTRGSVYDEGYLFKFIAENNKPYFLQLWIYAYLFKQSFGYLPDEVSIISFVHYPEAPLSIFTGDMSMEDFVDQLPNVLTQILEEMYSEVPFEHNPRDNYITYCDYCG